jgi:hypothetical protein
MAKRRRKAVSNTPFRLLSRARGLKTRWLEQLNEAKAYDLFKNARWKETGGEPCCPECGSLRFYVVKCRPGWWKCAEKECRKIYSVTTGTIFHGRKLSYLKLVKLIINFTDSVKGISALKMSFAIDCSYKATYINLQKLRQAMAAARNATILEGEIEIDGAVFGGKIKPTNLKKDRQDRRTKKMRDKKRFIIAVRQREGPTVAFASRSESQSVIVSAIRALVPPDIQPIFYVDGHKAYDDLEAFGDVRSVDHGEGYSVNGRSSNLAESFFSRARRSEIGQYHHWSQKYLDLYAAEMCWRENRRFANNELIMHSLIDATMKTVDVHLFKGYYQHWELPDDPRENDELRWSRVYDGVFNGQAPKGYRLIA